MFIKKFFLLPNRPVVYIYNTPVFLFESSRVNFLRYALMPSGLCRDRCKNRIHYGRFNGLAYVFHSDCEVFRDHTEKI